MHVRTLTFYGSLRKVHFYLQCELLFSTTIFIFIRFSERERKTDVHIQYVCAKWNIMIL